MTDTLKLVAAILTNGRLSAGKNQGSLEYWINSYQECLDELTKYEKAEGLGAKLEAARESTTAKVKAAEE